VRDMANLSVTKVAAAVLPSSGTSAVPVDWDGFNVTVRVLMTARVFATRGVFAAIAGHFNAMAVAAIPVSILRIHPAAVAAPTIITE
jgi:hypothetical protein